MDDQDDFIRRYINRNRIKFINQMRTELLSQGFPGLHNNNRDRITRFYYSDGYFKANTELLDQILRIDNFPNLFIDFCQKNDCNPDLVRIIEQGIEEYNQRRNPPRPQGLQEYNQRRNSPRLQAAQNSNQDSKQSERFTDRLLKEVKNIKLPTENTENEGAAESRADADVTESNAITEKVTEDEKKCLITGLVDTCSGTREGLLNPNVDVCPCPIHSNNNSERNSNPSPIHKPVSENKEKDSCSERENVQVIESSLCRKETDIDLLSGNSIFPVCNQNNMDRQDPIKRASNDNKMEIMTTQQTTSMKGDLVHSSGNNENECKIGSFIKNSEEIANRDDSIDEGLNNRQGASNQSPGSANIRQSLDKSAQSENTESTESMGSYYLTTSDEEEFEPTEENRVLEIDDLKEPISPFSNSEEPEQSFDSMETANENLQNARTKDKLNFGALETSEAKFIVVNSDLSGIQCQEDIQNKKIEAYTKEKMEDNTFHDVRGTPGEMRPSNLLDSSNEVSENESIVKEKTYKSTPFSHFDGNEFETDTGKRKTNNQEQVELGNIKATYANESSSLLPDCILSPTDLNQVEVISRNETTDPDQTQCKTIDCHSVHFIITKTDIEETSDIDEKFGKDVGSHSSGQISFQISSNTSELNTCTDLLASQEEKSADSNSVTMNQSHSDHSVNTSSTKQSGECKKEEACLTSQSLDAVIIDEAETVINHLTSQDLTTNTHVMRENANSGSQINIPSQILTEVHISHSVPSQNGSLGQNNSLVETNHEIEANSHIADLDNNNSAYVNNAIPNTRSHIGGHFYSFLRNAFNIYFPELGIRF